MTDSLISETDVVVDPDKNYLEEFVGEGKRYKDNEALAKSKFHGDQTIELYKKRMDEFREENLKLRQETNTKARLEELIEQYQQKLASSEHTTAKEDDKPAIKPEDIETLVSKKIQENKVAEKAAENFNKVKAKLQEQFGDSTSTVLKQRSTELGLSTEDLDTLARKSPAAFFRTLGLDQQQQETFTSPPRSQQRQDNFAPSGKKQRTWSYYQELKKADPLLYYDPKIAVQMQKDAIDMGDAFRDGDYFKAGVHDRN